MNLATELACLHKPTATIHISNDFTLVERKLLNLLMWHGQSQKTPISSQPTRINVSEAMKHVLPNSRNTGQLKNALRKLISTLIEWNILDKDNSAEWVACTFLSSGKIKNSELTYRINPEVIEQINSPRLYAKIKLLMQADFKSKHSLMLYEYFIDYLCRNNATQWSFSLGVDSLYKLCGCYDRYHGTEDFRYFNRDVIKKAIDDINNVSDLIVSYDTVKENKTIVSITFAITNKDSLLSDIQPQTQIKKKTNESLISALCKYNISRKLAKEIISEHDGVTIRDNIAYALDRNEEGKVECMPSYIVAAIRHNYAGSATQTKTMTSLIPSDSSTTDISIEKSTIDNTKAYFESLSRSDRDAHIAAYEVRMKNEGNHLIIARYKKTGFKSPLVANQFYSQFKSNLSN